MRTEESNTKKVGGIGVMATRRGLLKFFGAKGHKNVVLRTVDVLELRNDLQDRVIEWSVNLVKHHRLSNFHGDGWRKRWLVQHHPNGWIVIPIERLLNYYDEFADTKLIQEVVSAYTDIRRQKGEPSVVEACPKCNGLGTINGVRCDECWGEGQIITVVEMSAEERALAMGVS